MISVVIPTLNAERVLGPTLAALIPATVDGLVRQVVIADGGSADRTLEIAEAAGADIVTAGAGRGYQLLTGAESAPGARFCDSPMDQALLIPSRLYGEIGGFRPMPLMEDVDIVRRLGRDRIIMLRSRAITSASRYQRHGYGPRVARNLACLALYYMRVPIGTIARLYG